MGYTTILSKFKVKDIYGYTAKCVCPNHKDQNASLSISYDEKTDKVIMKCHAGCNTADILNSVGLTFADLGSKNNIVNNEKDKNIEYVYTYVDKDGQALYEKIRFKGKKFAQRRVVDNCTLWGLDSGVYYETFKGSNEYSTKYKENAKSINAFIQEPTLYKLNELVNAIKKENIVFICEGEKDVHTLNSMGFIATTNSTGAGTDKWLNEYCEYFIGANVIILPDNDETGIAFGNEIKRKLKNYANKTKIVIVSNKEKGDITDYVKEGHKKDDFLALLSHTKWDYAPWILVNEKTGVKKVNQGILTQCIKDTLRYMTVGRAEGDRPSIYVYKNGVYNEISKLTLKSIVANYLPTSLKTDTLINSVANMLISIEPIEYKELQGDRNIINLQNGLYNVSTDELLPHTPNYKSNFQLKLNYSKEPMNSHVWDNFIDDLTSKDDEIKNFLQEWFGLALSNYDASIVKGFLYITGLGDCGKSVPIKILQNMLTDKLFKSIDLTKLGDRFSLGDIGNKRIIACGDVCGKFMDDNTLGIMKQLTGGDIVSVEKKGKDSIDIHYRGLMMFAGNHIPSFNGDLGKHVFERINIIPCNNVVEPEKRDKFLCEKILNEKEYVFQWALKGLKRLIDNDFRFTVSSVMQNAKEEYSLDIDSVRAFIKNNYNITGEKKDRCKVSEVYKEYENYCIEEDLMPVSKKNFKTRLLNLNIGFVRYCGVNHYTNIIKKEYTEVSEDGPFY